MADPVLNESVRVPTPRFVPTTRTQYLTSVFTMWGLLDGIMYRHRHEPPLYAYGYMRRIQLEKYSRVVFDSRGGVQTYCEVGVNGGHGTAAMLLASPTLVAHSWDEGRQGYSKEVFQTLTDYFGDRLILHKGNSHRLLPEASKSFRRQCDLLLVDGDHSEEGAFQDIRDMREMAACNATLFLDDVGSRPKRDGSAKQWFHNGPARALARAADMGLVEIIDWTTYDNNSSPDNPCLRDKMGHAPRCLGRWGWAMARFRHPAGSDCAPEGITADQKRGVRSSRAGARGLVRRSQNHD